MKALFAMPLLGLGLAAGLAAQDTQKLQAEKDVLFIRTDGPVPAQAAEKGMVVQKQIMAGGPVTMSASYLPIHDTIGGFEKSVKNAPFSADAVTEFTQTLADGNRISRTTKTTIARDAEGRVRREESFKTGPLSAGPVGSLVFITDPVEGVQYILNPAEKTASKIEIPKGLPPPPPGAQTAVRFERRVVTGVKQADEAHASTFELTAPAPDAKPEVASLGSQMIEGVSADGQQVKFSIAPGEIGNQKQIDVIHETWTSPDLQTVVMRRDSDPRVGETVYKLTNLQRSAPDPSLFQVPADYKIHTGAVRINLHD